MTERGPFLVAIGGEAGCLNLATAFYAKVAREPELKPLFPGKSLRCATEEFSAFLIQFLGGEEEMTQYRWWLSLRESHARFKVTEAQRLAWLKQMELTLHESTLPSHCQTELLQFFASISTYVLGGEGAQVNHSELAHRWESAQDLETLVSDIRASRDGQVLGRFNDFSNRPSLFVGILSELLSTARPALVAAVVHAVEEDPRLAVRQNAGRTLLHAAAAYGCTQVVSLLLGMGIDPDIMDVGRHTPLYSVANQCNAATGPEIVSLLVQAGADVNHAGGVTRCTPLHMAARRGHLEVAQALLRCGARPDARDRKGQTPLDRAVNCRKPEVVELLRNHPYRNP